MVFDEYAAYYDLLYRDKDYVGEAEYIDQLLRGAMGGAKGFPYWSLAAGLENMPRF